MGCGTRDGRCQHLSPRLFGGVGETIQGQHSGGCVGVCLGGGYALRYSAFDPRIGALALVAAAFNDPKVMRQGMGDEAYRATMARFAEIAQRQDLGGPVEYLAAVSDVGGAEAAMPGAEPWGYYGTERSSSPGWRNQVTRLSIRELLTFDAAIGDDFVAPTRR